MASLKIYLQQSHRCQDFPTMIQVHKEQAKLVNAQSHLYGGTKLNMHVTKHSNVDQTFWIFFFLYVFGFLTQSK